MIFDDLKNITFYKGIHPNLDKAIDYLYQHRKDSFELGKYEIDGDKVFLVVQENVLNQAENDQFEHHKNYADLHLLVEGHEYSSYGSRIKDEAVAFDEASDIGFVHCHVGLSQFCDFLSRRTTPAKWLCRYGTEGSQISL